ncbi:MAG: hypothetical protein AAF903_12065 [Pseudomonadota bacterium]
MSDAVGRGISKEEWLELRQAALVNSDRLKALGGPSEMLLGFQRRLLRSVDKHDVTVCSKSRRTGATWAIGSSAVLTSAARQSDGGMDTFYIGYNLEMAREFIDVCAMWAAAFERVTMAVEEFIFEEDKDKAVKAFRIRMDSGFEIVALSSRPRSLRGKQGFVILDEAAFHDDLPGMMKAALALLIWGGKVCVISTHDGEMNPFNEIVNDVRAKRLPYNLVEFDFDDALKDGLYRRICNIRRQTYSVALEAAWRAKTIAFYGADADEELFCIPSIGSGIYLPRALIEKQQRVDIPVLRWEPPAEDFTEWPKHERQSYMADWIAQHVEPLLAKLNPRLRHVLGQDYAYAMDLSVLWVMAVEMSLRRVTPFIVEMRRMPFEQQKQLFFHIAKKLPRFTGAGIDANGSGQALAQVCMQEFGARRVEEVQISRQWYRAHVPPVKAALEDDNLLLPQDDGVLTDFRMVRLNDGVPMVPKVRTKDAKDGNKRHGDSFVAAVLAYAASDIEPREYQGYESASINRVDDDYEDDAPLAGGAFYRTDGL